MDKAIEKLVEAIQQASPAVWAAAQAQVQASILVDRWLIAFTGWGLVALGVVFLGALIYEQVSGEYKDWPQISMFISGVGLIFTTVIHICTRVELFYLINAPQWAAIKEIAKLAAK